MKKMTAWVSTTIVLLILIILVLCFFQFPSYDDYVAIYLRKKFGQAGSISWYLTYLNGRFSTIPIYLLICTSLSLMAYYPWLLMLFILIAFFSIVYFVRYFSRIFFQPAPAKYQTWLIAAMMLVVFLATVPEIATFIYWLSTSITYLLPFSLFLFFLVSWTWLFYSGGRYRWYATACICLLLLLLGGSNEIMMYFAFVLPFVISAFLLLMGRKLTIHFPVIMFAAIVMAALVLYMPGNHVRTKAFTQVQPLYTSMIGSAFRTWELLLIIFQHPVSYISSAGVMLLISFLKPTIVEAFSKKRTSWYFELTCLVILFWGFDLMIRQFANRVLPLRATNILVCLFLLGCWWIILMNAGKLQKLAQLIRSNSERVKQRYYLLFLLVLFSSVFFRNLIGNMIILPAHASVLHEREVLISNAKAAGKSAVYIPPYEKEITAKLQQTFNGKTKFVKEEFGHPPSFAFFMDEPYKHDFAYFYAEYHNIDTIIIDAARYPRWGLTNKFPNDRAFEGYE